MKASPAPSLYSGPLVLVNAQHPCRVNPPADSLVAAKADCPELLDRRAAALLDRLMQDIRGWDDIIAVSGWRPREKQRDIWDASMQQNGGAFTRRFVALPGHSEHQTGLAVDLGLKTDAVDFIRPAFPYTGLCQAFRERASRYGFIQRYAAGKESVTGIAHEPWHFRYVGIPHAEILTERGLSLEEYLVFLKAYSAQRPFFYEKDGGRFTIFYLAAGADMEPLFRNRTCCRMLSGNNMDGFIVTTWENGGRRP